MQDDSGDKKRVKLYLNNWERRLMPIMLLPNMVVLIRSAVEAKSYFRSNGMTTFTIIDYRQEYKYNNCSIFRRISLSHFVSAIGFAFKIYPGESCITNVVFEKFLSLKMLVGRMRTLVVLDFLVSDTYGYAVLSSNVGILQHLLNLPDELYYLLRGQLENHLCKSYYHLKNIPGVVEKKDKKTKRRDKKKIVVVYSRGDEIRRILGNIINDKKISLMVKVTRRIGLYELPKRMLIYNEKVVKTEDCEQPQKIQCIQIDVPKFNVLKVLKD